ncbi:hypothetical protein BJ742DRAFT_841540 [Cladochytrium replicatum]|nr:hypothetical protein BJ742DRAFT_841540 [Cladochytrium replicatum]
MHQQLDESAFSLDGFERLFTSSPAGNHIVAYILALEGFDPSVIDDIPRAFHRVILKHPRMRALQNIDPPLTARVEQNVTLSQVKELVTVYTNVSDWESHSEKWFNTIRDRTKLLPFFLHVLLPVLGASDSYTRLILYGDHTFADGLSGPIIFDQLLTELAEPTTHAVVSYPLLPAIFPRLLAGLSSTQRFLERIALKLLRPIAVHQILTEKPTLPLHPTSVDWNPRNITHQGQFAIFGMGTEKGLVDALAACRSHKVTLMGAIVACAVIATAYTANRASDSKFMMTLEMDYDMRERVKDKVDFKPVGLNSLIAALSFIKSGVDLPGTPFWSFAQKSKKELDAATNSLLDQRFNTMFVHNEINMLTLEKGPVFPKGFSADLNISNLLRYPYKETHVIAGKEVKMRHLYFMNSYPFLGNAAILFLVTVDGKVHSTLAHRLEENAARTFLDTFVKLLDAVGSARDDDTLTQFATRVLAIS